MYKIICDNTHTNLGIGKYILHDPRPINDLKLIKPRCKREINKTGSLTFQILPTHPYYHEIYKLESEILLYQDDKLLFCGRVLNDEVDFNNIKSVECEGELSYLLDVVDSHFYDYSGTFDDTSGINVVEGCLQQIIYKYNVEKDYLYSDKELVVGNITVTAPNNYLKFATNFESCLEIINKQFLDNYGGYLFIRHEDDKRYIDYVTVNELNVCNQTLEFGKNIIDMSKYIKGEDIYTCLIPLGEMIKSTTGSSGENIESRLELDFPSATEVGEEDDDFMGKDNYIYDPYYVIRYGRIWKAIKWDDVSDTDTLLNLAVNELRNLRNPTLNIEINAVDLHLLNADIDAINVGDKIRCISKPHNIDEWLIVKAMTIDIDYPENTTIELISPSKKIKTDDLITSNNKNNEKAIEDINNRLKRDYPTYEDLDKYNLNGGTVDLSDYAKKADVNQQLNGIRQDVSDINSSLPDYAKTTDLSEYAKTTDLSEYAKIVDVNSAFNELSTALGGL